MNKKTIFITLTLCVIIGCALFYAYAFYIPKSIEKHVRSGLNDMGFRDVKLRQIDHELGKVIFSDITFKKEQFAELDQLTAEFSLLHFLIDAKNSVVITLDGLKLTGALSEDNKLSIWGFDEDKENPLLQSIHARQIYKMHIKNAVIDVLSESLGGLTVKYDLDLLFTNNKTIELTAFVKTRQRKLDLSAGVTGKISADGEMNLSIKADQISLISNNFHLKRGHADLAYTYKQAGLDPIGIIEGDLTFASAQLHNLPLRNVKNKILIKGAELSMRSDGSTFGPKDIIWSAAIERNALKTSANISLTPMKLSEYMAYFEDIGILEIKEDIPPIVENIETKSFIIDLVKTTEQPLQGSIIATTDKHNLTFMAPFIVASNGRISGNFEIAPTTVKINAHHETNNATEEKTASEHKSTIADKMASFDLSSKGKFSLAPQNDRKKKKLSWEHHVMIRDGKIDYGALEIEQITGTFTKPQATSEEKKDYLSFQLPFKEDIKYNGLLSLDLLKTGLSIFERMTLNIYGGRIYTQESIFVDGAPSKSNILQVIDINLAPYIKDAGFNDTQISGLMGGIVPFTIEHENNAYQINVDGGLLQSQGTGVLKLPEHRIRALFPDNDEESEKIRQTLKNYHYEFFEIRLDGDLMGRTMMTLTSRGINPDLRSKKPVDINIQVETRPTQLIEKLIK